MKINRKINNVKYYSVSSQNVSMYNNLDTIFELDKDKFLYQHPINLQEINFNGKFYVNDIRGKGVYFNNLNQPIKTDYFIHLFKDEYVLYSKVVDDERTTFIENLTTNKKNEIIGSSSIYYLKNDFLFRKNFQRNSVESYNFPNATPLWEFDLSELGSYFDTFSREEKEYEVAKFLGVWQDELLIACNGGLILSLSVKSGAIIRKWDTLPPNSESTLREVFRGYIHQSGNVFQFNKNQDRIFGLYLCHLVEIDLEKGDILITHLKDTLESHQISAFQNKSGYAEDDTHYYTTVFLDKKKLGVNYMPTAICSLNKTTLKIDWLYRFDTDDTDDYVSVQVPQTSNNKLYQLTQNQVLYIFEKE
ncbi:hypothetical protein KRX57_08500 [Weeksellaceae bacterium TAE3-ERU29]|nr:hypothetical protein [Weeksellaceae bacterium TAE3-ERU29]